MNKNAAFLKMWNKAGFRERYAITHGTRAEITDCGRVLWRFTYDDRDPYQDANGATYDPARGVWTR